ncbi:MAG: N-(5'-phosphoribosyl)anthranilate isomerase, partial [Halocynthiibacter sp.]
MESDVKIKICGLREEAHVRAAVRAGAAYVGFVFFAPSPRNLTVARAHALALTVPPGIAKVALTVNAGDAELDEIVGGVPLDMLQLHGDESPARVAEVRDRYGLPVIKAVGISVEADLPALAEYGRVADQLLVDAKPAEGAKLQGGNGLAFDWRM